MPRSRHCEQPTGPARSGRPDDRLHDEAIRLRHLGTGLLGYARNDEQKQSPQHDLHPPPRQRGRGTAEGRWRGHGLSVNAASVGTIAQAVRARSTTDLTSGTSAAPSTTLRVVPLPVSPRRKREAVSRRGCARVLRPPSPCKNKNRSRQNARGAERRKTHPTMSAAQASVPLARVRGGGAPQRASLAQRLRLGARSPSGAPLRLSSGI
jgi:hypothetical protein